MKWSLEEEIITIYFRAFHQAYYDTIVDLLRLKGFPHHTRTPDQIRTKLNHICQRELRIRESCLYDRDMERWSYIAVNDLIQRGIPLFHDARSLLLVDDKVVEIFLEVFRAIQADHERLLIVYQQHENMNAMTDEDITQELDQLLFDLDAPSPWENTPNANVPYDTPSNDIPMISNGSISPSQYSSHLQGNATIAAHSLVNGTVQEQEADAWLASDASYVSHISEDISGNAAFRTAGDQTLRRSNSVRSMGPDAREVKPACFLGRYRSLLAPCSRYPQSDVKNLPLRCPSS